MLLLLRNTDFTTLEIEILSLTQVSLSSYADRFVFITGLLLETLTEDVTFGSSE